LEKGGAAATFAIFMSAICLSQAIGAQHAERYYKAVKKPVLAILILLLLSCLLIILSGMVEILWMYMVLLLILTCIRSIELPCRRYIFNDLLTSERRASGFGASSLVTNAGLIAVLWVIGYVTSITNASITLIILACGTAFIGSALLLMFRRSE
jgi:MFS family permease